MSKLRYEQLLDVARDNHIHSGLETEKINYYDIDNLPFINETGQYVVQITGTEGGVSNQEHKCGKNPIVQCVVGGEVADVTIRILQDSVSGTANGGDVLWYSNVEFTDADNAILIIYGSNENNIYENLNEYQEYWCGYEWNINDSDPSVTRITGEGMRDHFLQDGGGILKGTLFQYVARDPITGIETSVPINNQTEYEKYRYGQYGDLFAKMRGQLYYKVEREGDIRRKKISRYPLSGFKPYHANDYIVYIGLYEASCNNERTKIYSRVTPESEYSTHLGGSIFNATNGSYAVEKFYNTPATALSTSKFSDIAHSKGEGYDIMDYMTWLMLSDLFMAEFGTRNVQLPLQSNDINGYSQGGLGNGCTNVSNWDAYNGNHPVTELGCTDTHGSGCGQSLVPACIDMGLTPSNAVYANRFYGIENPFGHIYKLLTGIHFITKGNTTDSFEYYKTFICDDPSKFMVNENRDNGTDDVTVQFEAGYDYEGEKCHTNGYIKDVIFGDYGSMIPSVVGGGSNIYFADYNYSNNGEGGFFNGLRWSPFGSDSDSSWLGGMFYVVSLSLWNHNSRYYGTRLCYYKQLR